MTKKEFRLIPSGHEGSVKPAVKGERDVVTDTRSTVESQFRQMEKTHDRIRSEELAARLPR